MDKQIGMDKQSRKYILGARRADVAGTQAHGRARWAAQASGSSASSSSMSLTRSESRSPEIPECTSGSGLNVGSFDLGSGAAAVAPGGGPGGGLRPAATSVASAAKPSVTESGDWPASPGWLLGW